MKPRTRFTKEVDKTKLSPNGRRLCMIIYDLVEQNGGGFAEASVKLLVAKMGGGTSPQYLRILLNSIRSSGLIAFGGGIFVPCTSEHYKFFGTELVKMASHTPCMLNQQWQNGHVSIGYYANIAKYASIKEQMMKGCVSTQNVGFFTSVDNLPKIEKNTKTAVLNINTKCNEVLIFNKLYYITRCKDHAKFSIKPKIIENFLQPHSRYKSLWLDGKILTVEEFVVGLNLVWGKTKNGVTHTSDTILREIAKYVNDMLHGTFVTNRPILSNFVFTKSLHYELFDKKWTPEEILNAFYNLCEKSDLMPKSQDAMPLNKCFYNPNAKFMISQFLYTHSKGKNYNVEEDIFPEYTNMLLDGLFYERPLGNKEMQQLYGVTSAIIDWNDKMVEKYKHKKELFGFMVCLTYKSYLSVFTAYVNTLLENKNPKFITTNTIGPNFDRNWNWFVDIWTAENIRKEHRDHYSKHPLRVDGFEIPVESQKAIITARQKWAARPPLGHPGNEYGFEKPDLYWLESGKPLQQAQGGI